MSKKGKRIYQFRPVALVDGNWVRQINKLGKKGWRVSHILPPSIPGQPHSLLLVRKKRR